MAEWVCAASKDLPVDADTAWDGADAKSSVFEWAGFNGDSPDPEKARRGFLFYDRSAPELKGSYSLPFAAVQAGKLTALISGCRASASRLPQKDGVSDEQRNKARGVLDAYLKKDEGDQKSFPAAAFGFRVPVLVAAERAKEASSDADLLTIAKAQASDPSIFDEFPPAFFTAAVSTNQIDSYWTRMHKSSLQNFAEDLNSGVSLQDSHNTYERGLGYSLRGRYIGAGGNGVQRTLGDFYSVPSDPRKSAFVNDVRSASVRDVSVGFYLGEEGRYVCDLCGQTMWSMAAMSRDCSHYPGLLYPESDKEGATLVRATATIHGARLSEVSAVYDGATPGAGILKAQRAAAEGTLLPETARLLETQYRIHLPAARHSWAGADLPHKKEADMPDNDGRAPDAGAEWTLPAAERERYRTLVTECGLKPDASPAAAIEALRSQRDSRETERDTAVAERDALSKEVEALKPRAADGDTYRTDVVNETWGEYVRAGKADGKDEAATKARWQKEPLDDLKERLKDYQELAASRLPGGRLTGEGEQPTPKASPAPLHLYAV